MRSIVGGVNTRSIRTVVRRFLPSPPSSLSRLSPVAAVAAVARFSTNQPPPPPPPPHTTQRPYLTIQSPTNMSSSATPVEQLRAILSHNKIDALVIPTADAHQSEYVSDADQRRAFISEFTGSAGVAVVLASPISISNLPPNYGSPNVCGRLFTDGRYFLQAEQQLNPKHWELMKMGMPDVPKLEEWLLHVLPTGSNVAIDPIITSISSYKSMKGAFKDRLNIVFTPTNLVDQVWDSSRPSYSNAGLMILTDDWTGESSSKKVERIRTKMLDAKVGLLVVAALDEVAWLFNLRGGDIAFNPVFASYATITADTVTLYVDLSKVTDAIRVHLGPSVTLKPYDAIWSELKGHASGSGFSKTKQVWLDPSRCNTAIYNLFPNDIIFEQENPIQLMKAIKNPVEIGGMREAHLKDATAMIEFLSWLEDELLISKNTSLNECSVADKLEQFRSKQKEFVGLSFDTISGSGSNGAIIHYKPEPATCKGVSASEMFLLDSGAQYKDGTTDITRTMHFGQPTDFEKETFTRVLKGHITLAMAVFPTGTVGPTIDVLARAALWNVGLDYVHGTGHGVGAFLNVHEGPCGISSSGRSHSALNTPLQKGMILSNEPGYYEDGKFGIRIESLIVVAPRETPYQFQKRQYLGFETITLVPIQRNLIQVDLLSDAELAWLNAYHAETRAKLVDRVEGRAKEWLLRETETIARQ